MKGSAQRNAAITRSHTSARPVGGKRTRSILLACTTNMPSTRQPRNRSIPGSNRVERVAGGDGVLARGGVRSVSRQLFEPGRRGNRVRNDFVDRNESARGRERVGCGGF